MVAGIDNSTRESQYSRPTASISRDEALQIHRAKGMMPVSEIALSDFA